MARPAGPLRKYTVHCAWPVRPKVWRLAVEMADEPTARTSTEALLRMHHAVAVTITFLKPNKARSLDGRFPTAQWDCHGRLVFRHDGEMIEFMPKWALGLKEKADDTGS